MYSEKILNEFYNPENYGVIKGASGVGKVTSEIGNEIIKIYIKVEDEKVVEATFQAFGGVVAIACGSIAAKLINGKAVSSLSKFTVNDLLAVTGKIEDEKMYIVHSVVNAVRLAGESYYNRSAKDED